MHTNRNGIQFSKPGKLDACIAALTSSNPWLCTCISAALDKKDFKYASGGTRHQLAVFAAHLRMQYGCVGCAD
jgi:hypothetical protein